MKCPDKCSGNNRLRELAKGERDSIVEQDPEMEHLLTVSSQRCYYCGVVFEPSTPPKKHGWYGNTVSGGNGFNWERYKRI